MTLEEDFFEAFGIKPKKLDYPDNFEYYPEITDRILLKLICIIPKTSLYGLTTIKQLKEAALKELTYIMKKYNGEELKKQVQHIFRESNKEI